MKNKGILPDTCAWIDYFRPGETALGERLEKALTAGVVYVCGPVLYELVQGAKSDELVKSQKCPTIVIPVKTGIQRF